MSPYFNEDDFYRHEDDDYQLSCSLDDKPLPHPSDSPVQALLREQLAIKHEREREEMLEWMEMHGGDEI